jgi:hypothetical protein
MFRIEMLPAAHGDCLWIEYGSGPEVHRILIDGGPAHAYPQLRQRILHLPSDARNFDLLVITHIDADHIEGVIRLLLDAEALHCRFDRIWFNGREQLNAVPDPAGEALGGVQGEILGMLIADYESRTGTQVWNQGFDDAVAAIDPDADDLPVVMLPGECRLTLLSPDYERLLALKDNWEKELKAARLHSGNTVQLRELLEHSRSLRPLGDVLGAEDEQGLYETDLAPDDFLSDTLGGGTGEPGGDAPLGGDTSRANGSSIALLLEYPAAKPEVRFILSGDAWPAVMQASIERLLRKTGEKRLTISGIKLAHHGSVANINEALLAKLCCTHYLISTNGAIFGHPHARAVELLLETHQGTGKAHLYFNYLVPTTQAWSDTDDQKARSYAAFHPMGLTLAL